VVRREVANDGEVVPVQVDVIRSGGVIALPTGVVILVAVVAPCSASSAVPLLSALPKAVLTAWASP
jgi:hypothetical protein